jgi:hypothetical protein
MMMHIDDNKERTTMTAEVTTTRKATGWEAHILRNLFLFCGRWVEMDRNAASAFA